MHNLRRFYYQNKNKIWRIIAIIAFILIIIKFLNYIVKVKNEKTTGNSIIISNKTENSFQNLVDKPFSVT